MKNVLSFRRDDFLELPLFPCFHPLKKISHLVREIEGAGISCLNVIHQARENPVVRLGWAILFNFAIDAIPCLPRNISYWWIYTSEVERASAPIATEELATATACETNVGVVPLSLQVSHQSHRI